MLRAGRSVARQRLARGEPRRRGTAAGGPACSPAGALAQATAQPFGDPARMQLVRSEPGTERWLDRDARTAAGECGALPGEILGVAGVEPGPQHDGLRPEPCRMRLTSLDLAGMAQLRRTPADALGPQRQEVEWFVPGHELLPAGRATRPACFMLARDRCRRQLPEMRTLAEQAALARRGPWPRWRSRRSGHRRWPNAQLRPVRPSRCLLRAAAPPARPSEADPAAVGQSATMG